MNKNQSTNSYLNSGSYNTLNQSTRNYNPSSNYNQQYHLQGNYSSPPVLSGSRSKTKLSGTNSIKNYQGGWNQNRRWNDRGGYNGHGTYSNRGNYQKWKK